MNKLILQTETGYTIGGAHAEGYEAYLFQHRVERNPNPSPRNPYEGAQYLTNADELQSNRIAWKAGWSIAETETAPQGA